GADDPDAAGTGAVEVAFAVELHAVRRAIARALQLAEYPPVRQRAVGLNSEGADVASKRVVDVKGPLVRREGQAIRVLEVLGHRRQLAVRRKPEHALERDLALDSVRVRTGWVGEVDAAVGMADDVVCPVQGQTVPAFGEDGDAAVRLGARDAAHLRPHLAAEEAALPVQGLAIGGIVRLAEDG